MKKATERIELRLTPEQRLRLDEKMREVGVKNISAYIRKMALDGVCVKLNMDEIRQITRLLSRCSANLNQYAKRANETGNIYKADIQDLQKSLDEIWELHRQLLKKLALLK